MRLPHASSRRAAASDPFGDHRGEGVRDQAARLEPERDRERRRVPHGAAADRLGERVDPRVRGRRRREPVRQDGVDERVLGAHVRVPEAHLPVALRVGQDARARDLAPGPRRRRAEDERISGGGAGVRDPPA